MICVIFSCFYCLYSESEIELIDLEIQKLLQKEVIVPSTPEKSVCLLYSQFLNLMEVSD